MESTTYTINGKEFELQHHGVKGMKWGVRKKREPYRQDLGGGVTAVWPSKKAFKKAEKQRIKKEKANFKADVKDTKKRGMAGDYEFNPKTGQMTVTQWYDRNGNKVSQEYAAKIQGRVARDRTIASFAGTAAFIAGASAVAAMLGKQG